MTIVVLDLESALLDCLPAMAASLNVGLHQVDAPLRPHSQLTRWLRHGRLDCLRDSLGELRFRRALAAGADHYRRRGQFLAQPYDGIGDFTAGLAAAGVGVALISRMPLPTVQTIVENWELQLPLVIVCCPDRPSCASWRRRQLTELVVNGQLEPANCVCLSDDMCDLGTAEGIGAGSLFAGYGRLPWCRWRSVGARQIAETPALVPARVLELAAMRQVQVSARRSRLLH